LNEEVA
jgi:NDP-sugar pyrophosphorylase family protein